MSAAATSALASPLERRGRVSLTKAFSYAFSALAIAFLAVMIALFVWQSLPVWRHEGIGYVTGQRWYYRAGQFGALPMIFATALVAVIALVLAAPVGISAALFTAEIVPARVRLAVKILVELLAGVPSVVYGLLGILYLRNWVYRALTPFDPLSGDTLLTAGILLAVMILPTVMTLSDDALRGVPAAQRHAARGLGLTRAETAFGLTLPQALPGIAAALLLGLGRALGETIAVFLVVGRQDNQPLAWRSLLEAGQTLTSKLGGSETNIAYGDPLHWAAMVGLGLILLATTVVVTLLGSWLAQRRNVHAA